MNDRTETLTRATHPPRTPAAPAHADAPHTRNGPVPQDPTVRPTPTPRTLTLHTDAHPPRGQLTPPTR
jgi:hypothetical protein